MCKVDFLLNLYDIYSRIIVIVTIWEVHIMRIAVIDDTKE